MSILDDRPWYYVIYKGPDSYIGVTDYLAAVAYDNRTSLSFMTQRSRLLNYLKKGRADYKTSIRLALAIKPASVAGYGNYLVRQRGHLSVIERCDVSTPHSHKHLKSARIELISYLECEMNRWSKTIRTIRRLDADNIQRPLPDATGPGREW
jgi:hypothetical protein